MNLRKLLIAIFAAGGLAVAAQDPQPLQLTLVENSTDTYKVTSVVNESVDSPLGVLPLNIKAGITYKLKTVKVDVAKGSADVEATTTIDSLDGGDGPLSSQITGKKPGPIVQQGTISKYAHLDLKPAGGADPTITILMGISGSLQSSLLIELPDHAVKIGDTWDIIVPKSAYTGSEDQKITAKLTGTKSVDGKDLWMVDLSGAINLQFDTAKVAGSDTTGADSNPIKYHIIMKGTNTITGSGMIDKATGHTISVSNAGDLKLSLDLPDQGDVTATATGQIKTDVKLQPDSK